MDRSTLIGKYLFGRCIHGLRFGCQFNPARRPYERQHSQYISGLKYTSPKHTFGENEDAFLSTGTDGFRKLGSLGSTNLEFVFTLNKSKKYVHKTG